MDAMRFFGFIGIVLAGGVLMAFMLELLSTERRGVTAKRRVEEEPAAQSIAELPAFFAKRQSVEHPLVPPVSDDALIAFLEAHVRAEHAMVTKFVHLPSLDTLYRQAKSPPTLH
jgi:hypothetical protein